MPLPSLPNHLPALPASAPYRLALVLPWPSEDDCRMGKPLTGAAGAFLRGTLAGVGLALDECAICHVSQSWVPTWEAAGWEGAGVQAGIAALARDLAAWQPNLVLGLDDPRLGAGVLHLLRHGNAAPHRTPSGYQWESKLGKWRGSLFQCIPLMASAAKPLSTSSVESDNSTGLNCGVTGAANFNGSSSERTAASEILDDAAVADSKSLSTSQPSFKSLTSYAPSYILAVWSKAFDLRQDVRRARDEARSPQLNLPQLRISYGPAE